MAAIAALAAPATPANAQWSVQSPVPTFLEVRGIAAPAPGRLLLATDDDSFDQGGALFDSTDGGATWAQRNVPESTFDALHGIEFLDGEFGWVWGNSNYRTLDGGDTWQALPFVGSTYFMQFHSTSFGVASGNFGVAVSRDGGLSWDPSPEAMSEFSFADPLVGLGAAATGIFRTTDGGATFAPVEAGEASAVAFLTPSVAVAVLDDTFVRSTDGGLTWTEAGAAEGRSRLFAVTTSVALAWGRTGTFPDYDVRVFRTDDGGQSWTDLGEVLDPESWFAEFTFSVRGDVVLASDGSGDLHRSTDAGATWTRVFETPGPRPSFFGRPTPVFTDPQTAYFGFGPGLVLRTTDAGATWTQISSGSGAGLEDLARFANGDLVAVGEAGAVLTSVGGAAPWRLRGGAGGETLVAVQVIGAQEVVAVGTSGVVHRSTDAGATWTPAAPLPLALEARDVHFVSPAEGWVIGAGFAGSSLFRTANGGGSWAPTPGFQGLYVALDFAGGRGWALRYDGAFQRSVDGGDSWSEHQLPGSDLDVRDLDFWSADVGYAVGDGGYAVRSADGGLSWQLLPTPDDTDRLTDIHLIGPDELWVSSADGTTLYSATGGQDWAALEAGEAAFGSYLAVAGSPAGDAWIVGWRGAIRRFSGPPPPPVNQPPVASFDFHATGLSVAFTDTSTDADGTIVSWLWEFGDGDSSTAQNPSHLFAAAGTWHVRLTVTDDDGATAQTLRFVVVQPGPGGTFGDFTEVTPLDPLFVTPQDEDFWVSTTAPADYDGDGDLDVAVLGFYVVYNESVEHMLVLLRNEGPAGEDEWDFSYVQVPIDALTAGASDLAWGDVDGDGDQDLAVGSDGETALYRNDEGALVRSDTLLPGYGEANDQADFDLRSITWADFDNDGDLDLLLPSAWDPSTFEHRTALMRNDGANGTGGSTFTEVEAGLAPTRHAQSAWADFDGDQDLDLLLVHLAPLADDGFIRRYRNDGDGVFVGEDILGALTVEHGEAQWGDYDDDGDLDVLIAGHVQEVGGGFEQVLRVYRNDDEAYVAVDVLECPACDGWFDIDAATWADYDSDGDVDILLAGTYNPDSEIVGRAKIYDNVDGTFVDSGNQLPAPRSMGDRGGTFSWLDLDGEGDLDYFIAGSYPVPGGNGLVEAQMHVYLNEAEGENQPPSAPSQLDSQVYLDGSVDLWWNPALDDSTPAASLTYELGLYRAGSPVATERRLPEPGGVGAAAEWALAGLEDGVYTWTLEAVDSAYNAGPIAQGDFVVGEPPVAIFADGFESGGTSAWTFVAP